MDASSFAIYSGALLLALALAWLIGKFVFKVVCLNYGLVRVQFELNLLRLEIVRVEIVKHVDDKIVEIRTDKVWLSSCYLNRNINDRVILGVTNVTANITSTTKATATATVGDGVAKNFTSIASLLDLLFFNSNENKSPPLVFDFRWYFKYIGCVILVEQGLTVRYQDRTARIELYLSRCKAKFKPETTCVSVKVFDMMARSHIAEIFVNKMAFSSKLSFQGSRASLGICHIEIDSVNLVTDTNVNMLKKFTTQQNNYVETDETLSLKLTEFWNKLDLFRVNKFLVNNRFELCKLELTNQRDVVGNIKHASILSIDCFKNSQKLLKNWQVEYCHARRELISTCDFFNMYINTDLLNAFGNFFIGRFTTQSNYNRAESLLDDLTIYLNHSSSYINLTDDDYATIVTIGAKSFNLEANLRRRRGLNMRFLMNYFLIFKSDGLNNLFQSEDRCDLFDLFKRMNDNKFVSTNTDGSFNHIWGNLVNINELKLVYRSSKSMKLFIDRLFVEYSQSFHDSSSPLLQSFKQIRDALLGSERDLSESLFNELNIKINQANVYSLFERLYFVYACWTNFGLVKKKRDEIDNAHVKDSFSLKIDLANCAQFRLDELENTENKDNLSRIDDHQLHNVKISYLQENENSNLIYRVKEINLNLIDRNDYYLIVNDILFTWSLKIHFILNEILFKHVAKLVSSFSATPTTTPSAEINLKILVESTMLVNFLLDYSQDSSKVDKKISPAPQTTYFNSHFNLIETVSIILNDVCLSYALHSKSFSLCIDEISMLVNMDDQSLKDDDLKTAPPTIDYDEESSLTRRKFFSSRCVRIAFSDSDRLLTERKLIDAQVERNQLVEATFDSIWVNYLFRYDFAKLLDHVLNVRKCLMLMHGLAPRRSRPHTAELSYDFYMSVRILKLCVEDDPFEVKLAYNYALIADEHLESIKRRQTLEQRRSIRENNLERHALELLREREAKIYLQRSQAIYYEQTGSRRQKIRTELFCMSLDQLELYALCDSQWHGRNACYRILREIDHDSAPPSPNADSADHYSILWCRHVNFSVGGDFKLSFRDYTQPLLRIQKMNMWGKLLGAEYEPMFRSRRVVKIGISSDMAALNNCSFEIERSMSPFKFYHDLSSKMGLLTFAYGPCWEGSMAQLNLSLERIIHPARDPSRPMPWWDKTRLYLHGRFTALIHQCQIIYHVSMDPYNRTEEMKLVWSRLYFDWTSMKMLFKGVLDVFLNTESKYDDCRLLHLPNLELELDIDWMVKKQEDDSSFLSKNYHPSTYHNECHPCSPDKISVVVNSVEHDSYAHFRSQGVNLSFSIVVQQPIQVDDTPTCKFYASTLRFLERIKLLLSTITRPTKRGRLFRNVRPRKPILSRHFRTVRFALDLPDSLKCIYWSSASELYGVQVDSGSVKMNSALRLELTPFNDSLKRRPRPNWFVDMMQVKVEHLNFYLMSPDPTW